MVSRYYIHRALYSFWCNFYHPLNKRGLVTIYFTVPGAPPSNTTGLTLNSTHVYLTWDPPPPDQINGIIQGYRINITELNTGPMSQFIVHDTEAVIGPLHPHYNYNFSIVAFTLVGHGPTTYVVLRTTEAGMCIFCHKVHSKIFYLYSTIKRSRVLPGLCCRPHFN